MWRRHGHQALDSGEGYGAALGGAHEATADAILAVVFCGRGEDAVRPKALHGHGHTVCEVGRERSQSSDASTVPKWLSIMLGGRVGASLNLVSLAVSKLKIWQPKLFSISI